MSGNGGGTCELCIGVHTTHGVGHTVRGRTSCHVIGVEGTACAAAGCYGEVANTVFLAPLLVGTCNGVLESGGVGGVTGDGNAYVLKLHDSNALGNVVGAIALNVSAGTLGECLLFENGNSLGVRIKCSLYIGKAVDAGDDVCCILAQTVEDNAQGLGANLVCIERDLNSTLCSCKGLVTCQEAEALGLLGEEHLAQVAVAKTNLAVFSNRAGNAEALQTDTDSGSGVRSFGATLLDGDGCADNICPLSILKADGLGFFDDLVRINAVSIADLLALVDGVDSVFLQCCEDLCLASFITFKFCHDTYPPLIIPYGGQCTLQHH